MSVSVELPSRMLNLGLVSRTSTHSPLVSRSQKSRCPIRESCSPCRAPSSPEALSLSSCLSSPLVHQDFPHFQPPHESLVQKKCLLNTTNSTPEPKKCRPVFPMDLAAKLCQPENVLIIDCRSFIAFNLNHINGALNISCSDRMTKKRLQCNKVKPGNLIGPGRSAKEEFREKVNSALFVLYDDDTEDMSKTPMNSPIQLVLHSLHREGIEAVFLKGGLSAFQGSFGQLCVKPQQKSKAPLFSPTTPIIHSDIDTATVSEILPFLYLGNERDAANRESLRELGITHILNVTSHLPLFFEGDSELTYRRLAASDSAHQNLQQYFDQAFAFIDEARQRKGKVMVHCQAGVSRSSTLVIAYIMRCSDLSMAAAFQFVKSKRPIIAPNFNFMGQLMDFERQVQHLERDLEMKLTLS